MTRPKSLAEKVGDAAQAVRARTEARPLIGVVLGTGLGGLTRRMTIETRIGYGDIPFFPASTTASHAGALVIGSLSGKLVAVLEGRHHVYEGYSLESITLPVRVLKALGVEVVVFSNAAGGLNPQFSTGDIMILTDHINLMGLNPLVGPNDDSLGPRFPDMSEPYDLQIAARVEALAIEARIRVQRGVYVALTGPCLETRAEYRFLRLIGADAVGMSTVPEVIVARHAGLRVAGLSCLTDLCLPDALKPVNIDEILRVAAEAEPKLTGLVSRFVETYEPGPA